MFDTSDESVVCVYTRYDMIILNVLYLTIFCKKKKKIQISIPVPPPLTGG